jgi:DNA-binding NarL/FixJ family response regulator
VAVRLLIVDDHALFLEGLARTLDTVRDFEVVGRASDGLTAITMWDECRPDLALVDLFMPGIDGIETVRRVRAKHANARLMMLTSSEDQDLVMAALDAGATGYISKAARYTELIGAVREVVAGGRPLGESIARKLAARDKTHSLTARELEVLRHLREGLTLEEIGQRLGITFRTVRAHAAALKEKLDAANTAQVVARGFERGLLPLRPTGHGN